MRKLSLVLFLVACGDDGARHTHDAAPQLDGAPDSPIADAAGTPVTIAAVLDGQPAIGVHVYFQNADSSLVLATTTDASGTASAVMAAGGYVTAVDPFGGVEQDELDTFVGVKPGDHLVLARSTLETATQVTVQAPDDTAMTNFFAYSPCNLGGTQLSPPAQSLVATPVSALMTLNNCGATTDFIVTASNGSGGSEFLYAPTQAIVDQGTVDLTASTYAPSTSRTITYTNVPALRSMQQQADVLGPAGPVFEFNTNTTSDTIDPTITWNVPLFSGAVDVLQTVFNFKTYSTQTTVDWGQLGSAATIDVASRALSEFTGPPTLDPATHQASIPADTTTGLAPDFSLFALSASRQSVPRNWVWFVTAPYGASVTLPTVPTDVFDFNVGSGDSYNIDSWVNGKVPGGYDAVRALVLSVQPYLYNSGAKPQDLVLGGSGTASFIESESALALKRRVSGKPAVLRHRTR